MRKVVAGMTMSVDGYINDRNGDTRRLYPELDLIRELEIVKRSMLTTGAVLMGRRAYEMAQGDLTDYEYQTPIFVVTHRPPARGPKGENDRLKVAFVTDGVESGIVRARDAAGEKDVTIVGGVSTIQQALQAGLVDELAVGIAPVMLGGGTRFFDTTEDAGISLEQVEVIASAARTDIRFRIIGGARL
jgi:dihydrofolate reductase